MHAPEGPPMHAAGGPSPGWYQGVQTEPGSIPGQGSTTASGSHTGEQQRTPVAGASETAHLAADRQKTPLF